MRNNRGHTLIELLVVMVLTVMLGGAIYLGFTKLTHRGENRAIEQQARAAQTALDAWVARQKTLAAAAAKFSPGPDGALVVGADALPALLTEITETLADDSDKLVADGDHIVSEAMRARDAYLTISWPQPYRKSYPRMNLTLPD